jgi:hypothetical protein
MDSFICIWQLLAPQGEYCRRIEVCRRLWGTFDLNTQRRIYRTIRDKLAAGKFVNENPYYAIFDNAYPPRDRATKLSFREYYERYGTTEERDGWKQVNPTGEQVIYVKQ